MDLNLNLKSKWLYKFVKNLILKIFNGVKTTSLYLILVKANSLLTLAHEEGLP